MDWYGEEVSILLREATAEGLEAAAFEVEGEAKQNIVAMDLIDTGFMLNSVYAKGPFSSSYGPGGGGPPNRGAFPEASLAEELEALVAVAADYSIFVEAKYGFLYQALMAVAQRIAAHIQVKAKEKGF